LALPPSLGPVRLIGIDGHAGSGKSTFAARPAEALGEPPVPTLHLDDLATHEEPFEWMERLRTWVLEPLARGGTARYRAYDWTARRFAEEHTVPAAPVVLVEGVGAGRRALRPHLACLLWMELTHESSWERGQLRDGPELTDFWDGWKRAEQRHFSTDPTRPFAELLILQGQEGYEVLPGPGETD
ncbi:uridine kinase, partial [Streptomyces sp. UNOC14_S4]|uniref:uridine kinase family protein n=1 Tax=Streptomyces sp. UNOC14_S4 TaxID=2872340 RepID=UPI001E5F361A